MKIEKKTRVKNRVSGLTYFLFPRPELNTYYLATTDGIVPSGQRIHRTEEELDKMFEIVVDAE